MLADPKNEARPFDVLKFSAGHPVQTMVLSPLLGVKTHFLRQSRLCAGETCPACLSGVPSKYAGYVVTLYRQQRRLLRLTQAAAFVGDTGGMFVPGRVIEVFKQRERRPLSIVVVGDSQTFDQRSIVSRVELLNIVARLHGLPAASEGNPFDRALEEVIENAAKNVRLALRGDLV